MIVDERPVSGSTGSVHPGDAPANDANGRFDLLETMAFEPATGVLRLDIHLERMKTSAGALGFAFDRHAARNALQAAAFHLTGPSRVRLMLARSGATAVEISPAASPTEGAMRVILAAMALPPGDPRRNHKTSDRAHYDGPRCEANAQSGADEVVFTDADGFLTEGSFTSLFVACADGRLATPPLSRGIIPGVLRRALIDAGRAYEADLRPADLTAGFLIGNSLRGLVAARLCRLQQENHDR